MRFRGVSLFMQNISFIFPRLHIQQVGRLQVHSVHNGCSSHCTQSTVVLILHFVFQTPLSSTLHHGQGSLCSEGKRRDDRHHLLRGLRLRLCLRDRGDQRPRGRAPWLPHPSGQAFIKWFQVDNCISNLQFACGCFDHLLVVKHKMNLIYHSLNVYNINLESIICIFSLATTLTAAPALGRTSTPTAVPTERPRTRRARGTWATSAT